LQYSLFYYYFTDGPHYLQLANKLNAMQAIFCIPADCLFRYMQLLISISK